MREVKEISATPKYHGVEAVVRVVEVDSVSYLDIRDRITIDGELVWGRGYLIPLADPSLVRQIARSLVQGQK